MTTTEAQHGLFEDLPLFDEPKPLKASGKLHIEEAAIEQAVPDKSANSFKTISEVAKIIGIPQYVLRFWETKFKQIKPVKRQGGRRFYRPEDIDTLLTIKHLLYKEGYTIKGARKAFEEVRKGHQELRGADVTTVKTSVPAKKKKAKKPSTAAPLLQPLDNKAETEELKKQVEKRKELKKIREELQALKEELV